MWRGAGTTRPEGARSWRAAALVVVDLDILDANVERLARVAAEHDKFLRVASKSVRAPELLKRIHRVGGERMRGLMNFSVEEAYLLRWKGSTICSLLPDRTAFGPGDRA